MIPWVNEVANFKNLVFFHFFRAFFELFFFKIPKIKKNNRKSQIDVFFTFSTSYIIMVLKMIFDSLKIFIFSQSKVLSDFDTKTKIRWLE